MRDASLTPLQLQAAPSGEPQPTTLAALLASAAAAASSPLVLFDRHVEKNGGLSMTKAFEESDCQYYGYQVLEHEFEQMVDALAAADTGGSPLRICVNGHSPVPDTWMEQARALGELPQHPRLVTMLRVRRPPDWYQSFYDWDQVPRMDAGWANQSSIVDWMPGDLQSRIVLHSHNAVKAQHRELENAPLNETECARALDLAGSVELLTTTEEMDRMWPVLRKLSGLELPQKHEHEEPKYFTPASRLIANDSLTTHSERVAPCDWKLYNAARQRTEQLLSDWDALVQRQG